VIWERKKKQTTIETATRLGEAFARKWERIASGTNVFWDVVVVTAADAVQGAFFEESLGELLSAGALCPSATWLVVSDPPGSSRIGCGGSTLETLRVLFSRFGESLWQSARYPLFCCCSSRTVSFLIDCCITERVLVLHSGGYSKRLPICSFTGKAFTLVPWCRDGCTQTTAMRRPRCCTLLEAKLAALDRVCQGIGPGIFVTCADVLEMVPDEPRDFGLQRGFTAFAHRVAASVALTHGVFVLQHPDAVAGTHDCLRFLHRATLKELAAAGALSESDDGPTALVDSSFFFDATVAAKLLDWYTRRNCSLNCEIDAYGDFLQPLGPLATRDYLAEARNAAVQSQELHEARESLFELLAGTPLRAVPLMPSAFVHFGTHKEFIQFMCGGLQVMGFPWRVCVASETQLPASVCAMESFVGCDVQLGTRCAVEHCDLQGAIDVGAETILSDIHTRPAASQQKRLQIPAGMQLVTVALDTERLSTEAAKAYGKVCFVTLAAQGDELKSNPCAWKEPLFPIAATAEDSLEATLQSSRGAVRVSWSDAVAAKCLSAQHALREALRAKISTALHCSTSLMSSVTTL